MKRLGKFSGKIYDENFDISKCYECCILITDDQASDQYFIFDHHAADLIDCAQCLGCPKSQGI